MENFDLLKQEYQRVRQEFRLNAEKILKSEFKKIFENTRIKSIRWSQYTPYFNDGDECVFCVNDPYFSESEYGDIDDGVDYWIGDMYKLKRNENNFTSNEIQMLSELNDFIMDDEMSTILNDIFGDHVEVIATIHGFDCKEYEHD